jgi:ribosome maturation protein SDO1
MVSLEKAVIARFSKDGKEFEVLVDPEKALKFRQGAPLDMESVLAVRDIFTDAKKGDRAPTTDLEEAFGTADPLKIAEKIVKDGQVQLTTEQRRKLVEEKKRQIADIISKQGINPQTKLPHPPNRVTNAMDQARVTIDPFKSAQEQVGPIVEQIQPIIPISFERVEIAIRIPMEYAGKANTFVRSLAPLKKEEWRSDAWIAVIEIPAGMQGEIYEKLNSLTAGKADVKVIRSVES